jgi:hypothetical protein
MAENVAQGGVPCNLDERGAAFSLVGTAGLATLAVAGMAGRDAMVRLLVVSLALAVGACAYPMDKTTLHDGTCTPAAAQALAQVDWMQARTVNVTLTDEGFDPVLLRLKKQQPYVFRFARIVKATEFFTRNAVASASFGGETVERPCLSGLNIAQGGTAEVRVVTTQEGRYGFSGEPFWYIPLTRTADGIVLTVE